MKAGKKTILLDSFFILLFLATTAFAQGNQITRQQLQDMTKVSGSLMTKSATETIGTPYLSDDFIQGHILMNEKARTESTGIRYNIEKNEVEFLRDKEIFIIDEENLSGFKLYGEGGDILFKNGYQTDIEKINSNTLLRVVYEGDVKLVVNYRANLLRDLSTYATATNKNMYNVYKNYYLVTENGKFHRVESPENDILKIFSDLKTELANFIEENSLELKHEDQIVRLLKFYEKISRIK